MISNKTITIAAVGFASANALALQAKLRGISVNKNTVPGDKSAMNPSGIRFGTPPLTTRKVKPEHIPKIVDFIHQAWTLALEVQSVSGPKFVTWKHELETNISIMDKVSALKQKIETYASKFPLPGHEDI